LTDLSPDDALAQAGAVPALSAGYTRLDMHKDFRKTFGTEEGRRVLGHIFALAGMWSQSTLMKGMTAAESALVHEARRMLALDIMLNVQAVQGSTDEKVIYGGRKR
jgi:hypothetical protein